MEFECPNAPLLKAFGNHRRDSLEEEDDFLVETLIGTKVEFDAEDDSDVPLTPGGNSLLFPSIPKDTLFVLAKIPLGKQQQMLKKEQQDLSSNLYQQETSLLFPSEVKAPSGFTALSPAPVAEAPSRLETGSNVSVAGTSSQGSSTTTTTASRNVSTSAPKVTPFNMWASTPQTPKQLPKVSSPIVASRRMSSNEDVKSLFPKSIVSGGFKDSAFKTNHQHFERGVHTGRMTADVGKGSVFSTRFLMLILCILVLAVTASIGMNHFPDQTVKAASSAHLCELIQSKQLRQQCLDKEEARKKTVT